MLYDLLLVRKIGGSKNQSLAIVKYSRITWSESFLHPGEILELSVVVFLWELFIHVHFDIEYKNGSPFLFGTGYAS